MSDEPNTLSNDASLAGAFLAATDDDWLGNPRLVEDALRLMLAAILDARGARAEEITSQSDFVAAINAEEEKAAAIFLGQDVNHRAVVGWNQPGGIDEHVAKELNISEPDPTKRVRLALRELWKEIFALVQQEEQGMPPENTRWQMEAAIEQTTKMFIGLPLDRPGPEDE